MQSAWWNYPRVCTARSTAKGISVQCSCGACQSRSRYGKICIRDSIHGQHEHQSLLYKKNHLQILDEFAKEELGTIKKQYGTCYQLFKEKQKELEKASIDEETRRKEADFLAYEINEIEAAHIKEDEDELLEEQYQKMCRSQKVMEHLQEAYQCCFGQDGSAGELLSRSAKTLQSLVGFEKGRMICMIRLQKLTAF